MNLIKIKSFINNYIWILIKEKKCIIFDPGISEPVLFFLKKHNLTPIAILLTHHHDDHVNGVNKIQNYFPHIQIYGPLETLSKGVTNIVKNLDFLQFSNFNLQVFEVPGHTLGHVIYYQKPYLFCGDTLFSGGCGRIFEGTIEQMFNSINKIQKLPGDTLICCAHEYTIANMKFANYLLPYNDDIKSYFLNFKQKIINNEYLSPSTINIEKKINVFFKTKDIELQKTIGLCSPTFSNIDIFNKLYNLKEKFKIKNQL